MAWDQSSVLSEWVLPAGVCAPVTWVCLVWRFRGEGRLLGTVRSAAGALAVVIWTAAMAALGSGLLLPQATNVPPAAVGVVAGLGLMPKRRAGESGEHPLLAIMTLGDSLLLHSLATRLRTDRALWCERMALGFPGCWELDTFADQVKAHLLARLEAPGRAGRVRNGGLKKEIDDRHRDVRVAAQKWITLERNVEKLCERHARERTPDEVRQLRRALGEAEHLCVYLLDLVHTHGKRSDDKVIQALRSELAASAVGGS